MSVTAGLARLQSAGLVRLLFYAIAAYAGTIFWIAPYPPMVDMPQHAAQITALRALLEGRSPWADVLHVNFYTPYLIAYGLGLALTQFMPVVAAIKVMLSLSYYGFVAACVALRSSFNADPRLDWLFIPSFFGLAYRWGFLTFLVAAPLGIAFLLVAKNYAERPAVGRGIALAGLGVALFFSHGLLFLVAVAIGALFTLLHTRGARALLLRLIPFVLLSALFIAYFVADRRTEASIVSHVDYFEWGYNLHRIFGLLVFIAGGAGRDWRLVPLVLILLAAPFLIGSRLNRGVPGVWLPIIVVLAIWAVVPQLALRTTHMYERFAMFLLPFYALLFRQPRSLVAEEPTQQRDQARSDTRGRGISSLTPWRWAMGGAQAVQAGQFLMIAASIGLVALEAQRIASFGRETKDFDIVLDAVEPARRAASLVFDPSSRAALDDSVYVHFPLWYQAKKNGLVDYNFAWLPPEVVRFRPQRLPAIELGFEWAPQTFNWKADDGALYRYFFVRHPTEAPAGLFDNGECRVRLLKSAGSWAVYERQSCRPVSKGSSLSPEALRGRNPP